MNRWTVLIASAALTLTSLAGAASQPAMPPPTGGTIAIEPRTADGDYDPSMHWFVDAAARTLTARGFTILDDPDHAASVVELTLSRVDVGTGLAKDLHGASVLVGPGVIVPFSTGNSRLAALQRTSLELRIRRRAESVAWDGTAVTVREAGTRTGTDQAVASDLSEALLKDYPAVPGTVVGVP